MERVAVGFSAGLEPGEVVECAAYAEELGYESAWIAEGHGGDQFTILTACALTARRIGLGTSISSVFARSAPTVAMAAACVDRFSDGRFILGLGSSHRVQVVGEHGLSYGRPIQRVREYVDIVRALLREGAVSYQGELFHIEDFDLWFEPLRREVPIYLGAVNPKMLEVCGEIAQGAILTRSTPSQVRAAVGHIANGALRAGRRPEEVEVALLLPCSVSDSRDAARDRIRGRLAMYAARFPRYRRLMSEAGFAEELKLVRSSWLVGDHERAKGLVPDALIDATSLTGTPEECREAVHAFRQAGVTLPIVSPAVEGQAAKAQAMEGIRACAPQ